MTEITVRFLRAFYRNTCGATTIYVTFAGSLALASGVLALDFGRMVVLKSQLQNAADAAALSAATQLNGLSGAINRATRLARDAVSHESSLADGAGTLTVSSITFYKQLEPTATETTRDSEAVFVRVALTPQKITIFLQPLVDLVSTGTATAGALDLDAEATSGLSPIICEAPPFLACNPAELNGASDDILDPINAGRQLLTKEGPSSGSLAPGNFGLLCPPTGSCGASAVGDALASDPGQCYSTLVTTSPGVQTQQVYNGVNARMDLGNKNPKKPAQNIKAYPRDTNMHGGRIIGNGSWNPNSYWTSEHPSEVSPANVSTFTRYQMYLYELGETFYRNGARTIYPTDGIAVPTGYSSVVPPGRSLPAGGSPTGSPSSDIKRRVMKVAVLNCNALNVQGSGSYPTYGRYIDVFLTEPVGSPPNADVYAEIIGPLSSDYTESYHVNVKLYD